MAYYFHGNLVQMNKPKTVPEVIVTKMGEFWSQTRRSPSETIDVYCNHFHELLDKLSDAERNISTKSAICHFLFTFGPEF
jgi:hypothetical protein